MAFNGLIISLAGVLCGLLAWYWDEYSYSTMHGGLTYKTVAFLGRVLPLTGVIFILISLARYLATVDAMCK